MESEIVIKVKKLDPRAILPTRGSTGAACFDVYTVEQVRMIPGIIYKLRTGLSFEVPEGHFIETRPRSGMSKEGFVICNSPGTLDSDYRGEFFILMKYTGMSPKLVLPGDRIAQIKVDRVEPAEFKEVEELSSTDRGDGGFGSTGR